MIGCTKMILLLRTTLPHDFWVSLAMESHRNTKRTLPSQAVILPVQYLQLQQKKGIAYRQDNCVAALPLNTLSASTYLKDPVLKDLLWTFSSQWIYFFPEFVLPIFEVR